MKRMHCYRKEYLLRVQFRLNQKILPEKVTFVTKDSQVMPVQEPYRGGNGICNDLVLEKSWNYGEYVEQEGECLEMS